MWKTGSGDKRHRLKVIFIIWATDGRGSTFFQFYVCMTETIPKRCYIHRGSIKSAIYISTMNVGLFCFTVEFNIELQRKENYIYHRLANLLPRCLAKNWVFRLWNFTAKLLQSRWCKVVWLYCRYKVHVHMSTQINLQRVFKMSAPNTCIICVAHATGQWMRRWCVV